MCFDLNVGSQTLSLRAEVLQLLGDSLNLSVWITSSAGNQILENPANDLVIGIGIPALEFETPNLKSSIRTAQAVCLGSLSAWKVEFFVKFCFSIFFCLSGRSSPTVSGASKPSDQSPLSGGHQPDRAERLRRALPVASGALRNDAQRWGVSYQNRPGTSLADTSSSISVSLCSPGEAGVDPAGGEAGTGQGDSGGERRWSRVSAGWRLVSVSGEKDQETKVNVSPGPRQSTRRTDRPDNVTLISFFALRHWNLSQTVLSASTKLKETVDREPFLYLLLVTHSFIPVQH